VPFIFVLFAVAGVLVGMAQRDRTNDGWAKAAHRLGMTFEPAGFIGRPRLSGRFGDVAVTVTTDSTGGKNKQQFTRYEVNHPPVGPAVKMTRQGVASGLFGSLIGRTDVLVGEPLFDNNVIVESDDAEQVRGFLIPARRAAVQELFAVFDHAEVEQARIRVSNRGVSTDPNAITATISRLVDIASVLADPELNTILGHRQDGHLLQTAEELHDFNRQRGNRFTSTLEAEALAEAGRHGQAAEAFDELWAGQPDEPVSTGWYDLAATADPPPLAGGSAVERTQQAIIEDVFASDRMSWEAVQHFEATYRDTTVEWSGTVVRADPYERDRDFDGGPGLKAVVSIGRAGRPGVISNEIEAVIELPTEAALHQGADIRFRGVLANVDRFSRKIWIRRASLI